MWKLSIDGILRSRNRQIASKLSMPEIMRQRIDAPIRRWVTATLSLWSCCLLLLYELLLPEMSRSRLVEVPCYTPATLLNKIINGYQVYLIQFKITNVIHNLFDRFKQFKQHSKMWYVVPQPNTNYSSLIHSKILICLRVEGVRDTTEIFPRWRRVEKSN